VKFDFSKKILIGNAHLDGNIHSSMRWISLRIIICHWRISNKFAVGHLPESVSAQKRFNLREEDDFYQYMFDDLESAYPHYDTSEYFIAIGILFLSRR
jgi:hypothetical protein